MLYISKDAIILKQLWNGPDSPDFPLWSCFRCWFVESAGKMKIGISGPFHNCLSAIASFATDVHTPFFCNWLTHFLPFAVGCWYIPCCIRWVRIIELSIPLKYSLNFLQSSTGLS